MPTEQSSQQIPRDLERRLHFMNQFDEVVHLGVSGKENVKREDIDEAIADLRELRGRTESMLEDLEEYR